MGATSDLAVAPIARSGYRVYKHTNRGLHNVGTFAPILHDHLARAFTDAGYSITQNDDDKFFVEYGDRVVAWHIVGDEVRTIESITFNTLLTVFDAVDHLNQARFLAESD